MLEARSAICLVIDRLSAAYVGALGNTWIHTPTFDRLAAQSLVFDRAMTDSPALEAVNESLWTGTAAWCKQSSSEAADGRSLPGWCRTHGVPTMLVTDDGAVAGHRLAGVFDEVVHLSQPEPGRQRGDGTRSVPTTNSDWQETQLAAFFAAAVELLDTRRPPALVWLHTGALGRIWDSPQPLRDQYAAADDPPAPPIVEPPSLVLDEQADPDLLLGLRHAYAGEVSVLDRCLGTLLDTIDGSYWRNALLTVTSCRGYPLGEHGTVGDAREALYEEVVRVPLCLRVPGGPKYGAHSQSLVQPADLYATMLGWLSTGDTAEEMGGSDHGCSLLPPMQSSDSLRTLAIARSKSGEIALATPSWFVRAPARGQEYASADDAQGGSGQTAERRIELFAQPDDYFQVNEVSDRCRDIVEEFREVVQAVESAGEQGGPSDFKLSEALIHGIESQTRT